jgi:hypothetical protein
MRRCAVEFLFGEANGNFMTSKVEYEITATDQVAKLEKFVQGSTVGRNFTWFAYFSIVALAWFSAILFYVKQGHQNYGYIFSGTVALVLTLTLPMLYRWYQYSFWASVFTPTAVRGLVGRKVLHIHDDFVEEVGEVLTIRVNWRDVKRIDNDPIRTWLILTPLIAIVIPNGAFHHANAREAFVSECRTRIAEQSVGLGAADDAVSNG